MGRGHGQRIAQCQRSPVLRECVLHKTSLGSIRRSPPARGCIRRGLTPLDLSRRFRRRCPQGPHPYWPNPALTGWSTVRHSFRRWRDEGVSRGVPGSKRGGGPTRTRQPRLVRTGRFTLFTTQPTRWGSTFFPGTDRYRYFPLRVLVRPRLQPARSGHRPDDSVCGGRKPQPRRRQQIRRRQDGGSTALRSLGIPAMLPGVNHVRHVHDGQRGGCSKNSTHTSTKGVAR